MSKLAKALTAAAGNAGGDNLYVEDVFSTYLYEGSGAARTIDNNIALSDEGGLVWLKQRGALDSHVLFDTVNGPEASLSSNSTDASSNYSSYLSFPSAGTTGWNLSGAILNGTGTTWASWTFRKAEKFFDVVTYTGTAATQNIAHNLGSTPGMIIVKSTTAAGGWAVWHNSLSSSTDYWLRLDGTNAEINQTDFWPSAPTDSQFTVGGYAANNAENQTLVAYLFASDAGGFGDDGSESIIKCGSYTQNGTSTIELDLGFEPEFFLAKRTDGIGNWMMFDTMRGLDYSASKFLSANLTDAESAGWANTVYPLANGIRIGFGNPSETYIYIAIRRPMKTPESGTEVFSPSTYAGTDPTPVVITTGFPVDLVLPAYRDLAANGAFGFIPRLTGAYLYSASTAAEVSTGFAFDSNTSFATDANAWNQSPSNLIGYGFKRATGFMDVVCYTGTGSAHAENHNLGVVPELMIVKRRNAAINWHVYSAAVGNTSTMYLDLSNAPDASVGYWNNTTPTSSVFTVGTTNGVNASGSTYIAYLFATVAGVSKVGSYTGTAAALNVDCGFTAGARFILIKRTDAAGDWYVYDSARGIIAGNDPYLLMNSAAAEVTSTDYIDPLNAGFTVTSTAPAGLNANGGNYIFLAIA